MLPIKQKYCYSNVTNKFVCFFEHSNTKACFNFVNKHKIFDFYTYPQSDLFEENVFPPKG